MASSKMLLRGAEIVTMDAGLGDLARGDILIDGGAIAVQTVYVKIWVPPEYALVGAPKNFSVQTRSDLRERIFGVASTMFGERDLDTWIGHDTAGIFDFPTEGRSAQYMNLGGANLIKVGWWHLGFYTMIISGAIVLIALVLRNTSWENKLTVVILGTFAAIAYSMKDYDVIFHGLGVAQYGLIAGCGIWVIHGMLCRSRVNPAVADTRTPVPVASGSTPLPAAGGETDESPKSGE